MFRGRWPRWLLALALGSAFHFDAGEHAPLKSCAASAAAEDPPHRPYSWAELLEHAVRQEARFAAGEYPGRDAAGNARYQRYKEWCRARTPPLSNAQYILQYVHWRPSAAGRVALEPALAPYLLADGLEHWILWHHPDELAGDAALDGAAEAALAAELVRAELLPEPAAGDAVRLPSDAIVAFQNVPVLRSLPTIAHAHVFFHRARLPPEGRDALARARRAWLERSPWFNDATTSTGSESGTAH